MLEEGSGQINYKLLEEKFIQQLRSSGTGKNLISFITKHENLNLLDISYQGYFQTNIDHDSRSIIYSAYYNCIFGDLLPEKVAALVSQGFIKGISSFCACILATFGFLNCLTLDNIVSTSDNSRQKFNSLVTHTARCFSDNTLLEFIEFETLEQSGLVKSAKQFNQKIVRLKTKLLEESEGYSKLVVAFNNLNSLTQDPSGIDVFVNRLVSVIGCFSLDPYRVLDLLIDHLAFSNCLPKISSAIVKKFQEYSGSSLQELIRFKLIDKNPSRFFVILLAVFISDGLVQLPFVYEQLSPSDEDLSFNIKILLKNEEELTKKITSASLQECFKISRQFPNIYRFPDCPKMTFFASFFDFRDFSSIDFFIQRFPLDLLFSFKDTSKMIILKLHSLIEPLYSRLNYRLLSQEKINKNFIETVLKSFPDIFKLVILLGYRVYMDTLLFIKIIRLMVFIMKNGNISLNTDFLSNIHNIICTCLLPGLTQLECNCVASEEIWNLIRIFPYHNRFRFYSHLKRISYAEIDQLIRTKIIYTKTTKFICKRITKDTLKQSGRQLGKLTHSNPVVVLIEVVNQVCSFDTMISPIVECLKYLTPLSFDVLTYTLIECLSINSVAFTSKITSIPVIIQNLGNFIASVMRKYVVSMTGVLQYIANQLKDNNPLDLIVLREILHKIAGVDEFHLNLDQLEYLAGSEILQEEAGVGFASKSLRKYSLRLKDALNEAELIFPLYFLIAQQRDRLVKDVSLSEIHIKLTGQLFDECHNTLVQYGRFISKHISVSDYKNHLPCSLSLLHTEYGLDLESLFFLIRSVFRVQIMNIQRNSSFIQGISDVLQPYLDTLTDLLNQRSSIIPHQLILVFWLLDPFDIYLPNQKYDDSIHKISQQLIIFEESKDTSIKKTKEKERLLALSQQLDTDRKSQKIHIAFIEQWIRQIFDTLSLKASNNDFLNQFLQLCVYSRLVFSPPDAFFSAEFLFLIHGLRSSSINSLALLDRVFCENASIIKSFSENEAHNYGLFLQKIWEHLIMWYSSSDIFMENCSKHPGFMIVSRHDENNDEFLNFQKLIYKWQYKQTKSFVLSLNSKDFVQIRNSVIVLTSISQYFPRMANLKIVIENHIEKLVDEERERRPDLFALVTCYSAILRNMKDVVTEVSVSNRKITQSNRNSGKDSEIKSSNDNQLSVPLNEGLKRNPQIGAFEKHSLEDTHLERQISMRKRGSDDVSEDLRLKKRKEIESESLPQMSDRPHNESPNASKHFPGSPTSFEEREKTGPKTRSGIYTSRRKSRDDSENIRSLKRETRRKRV